MEKENNQGAPDKGVSEVAKALKRLREAAGLSLAKMAKALGMTTTSYQHYEDRYKKPAFPRDFLRKVVDVLRKSGAPEDDIAELGLMADAGEATLDEVLAEVRALRQELAALRSDKKPDGGRG